MILWGSWRAWHKSEEFGRKNVIRVLSGKELCVSNTWFKREEKRKVIFRIGENEKKINFVLIKKEL